MYMVKPVKWKPLRHFPHFQTHHTNAKLINGMKHNANSFHILNNFQFEFIFFPANSHNSDRYERRKKWDEQTENENSTIAIFESRDQMHAQGNQIHK